MLLTFLCFLGCTLIGISFVHYLNKSARKQQASWEQFQKAEHEASFITKKSFPSEILLTFEKDKIPYVENLTCKNYYLTLCKFEKRSMVDLSEYTNLDLKKTYGINHFSTLVQYEETFFEYVECMYKYALCLEEAHYYQESKNLLEYMLSKGWKSQKYYTALQRICDKIKESDREI